MRYLAHAKVNLGLRVTGVRADGYHEIESLFVSVDLADVVTVSPGGPTLTVSGPEAAGVPTDATNLAVRAAAGAPVRIDVEKHIPNGAGLGGGSADAAAVLHAMGRGHDLRAGAALGADVPFCMTGGAAVVRGIGDLLSPVDIPDVWLVLVVPPVRLATASVYREWDRGGAGMSPTIEVPGVGEVRNDLAGPAFRLSPELAATAADLERRTGTSWLLTGSGSGLILAQPDGGAAADAAARTGGRVLRPASRGVTPLAPGGA